MANDYESFTLPGTGEVIDFNKASQLAAVQNKNTGVPIDLGTATGQQIGNLARQFYGYPIQPPSSSPIAALNIPETTKPMFALSSFSEAPEAKAERYAQLEQERNLRVNRATETATAAKGGVEGMFQKGSRTGAGYDSIKDQEIRVVQKELGKTLEAIDNEILKAKISGDSAAEDTAMKKYQLALQAKSQADTLAIQQAQLKLQALGYEQDVKNADRAYGLDLQKLGLDQTQFDSQMKLSTDQFEENKRQFGETQAFNNLQLDVTKANNETDREIAFQTLLNNTPAGQSVSVKLPDGSTKTGTGRHRFASSGGTSTSGVGAYTGKFSQDYLAQRADDYVKEDGTVDWLALDELENTNKDLWADMNTFLSAAQTVSSSSGSSESTQTQEEVNPAASFTNSFGQGTFAKISLSDRATTITNAVPKQPLLNREQLYKEGYNPKEVDQAIPLGGIAGAAEKVVSSFSWLFD